MPKVQADGLPLPQRYGAILTIVIGISMAVLDGAIANVALPTIATDLHATPASSIWVVNAYQIAIVISLLSFSFLGDMFGYRRIYKCGLVVFLLSSLFCALSDSLQMLAMVSLPFYLQTVLGRSEVETGLLLTPWPLATMVMAPLAGYLIERVHAGLLGALGLFIMAAGLFSLVLLPASPADINIIWPMILCGAGFGLFQSPNNHTIITSAPRERSGGASGMLGTARLLGQSSGAALVALMLNQFGDNGTHVSLIAAAILAVIAACVSGLRITQPRSRA